MTSRLGRTNHLHKVQTMKLTKAQYEALPDGLKALYKATGEDSYEPTFVTAEDHEANIAGLKKKNEELIGKDKASRDAAAQAEAERVRIQEEADRKNGNIEALDKSWKEKFDKLNADHVAELSGRDAFINSTLIDSKASELATKLGGKAASVLLPHIKPRLSVEKSEDGKYQTRILDASGQPSALTIDELAKEFRTNEAFASVIVEESSSGLGGGLRDTGSPAKKPDLMTSVAGSQDMMAEAMKLAAQ